jgi:hypothetical protein
MSLLYFMCLFFSFCEAIGTAATPGLLRKPRVIVKMYVCMYKGGPKTGPNTATFNDLFIMEKVLHKVVVYKISSGMISGF